MIKNLLAPVQVWLLTKGKCVGCGSALANGVIEKSKVKGYQKVTCKCGRIFMKDLETQAYRRALFTEV